MLALCYYSYLASVAILKMNHLSVLLVLIALSVLHILMSACSQLVLCKRITVSIGGIKIANLSRLMEVVGYHHCPLLSQRKDKNIYTQTEAFHSSSPFLNDSRSFYVTDQSIIAPPPPPQNC